MIIQHNMQAMNANRMLGNVVTSQSKSTEKLSSGYRINRAGDDAAGLAISEKMRGQIRGLTKASANAQDGISLIQTAEGALTETHSILQRMRELAVQAANDTNTDDDRTQIQNEIDQLTQEVDRIANTTEFNSKKLLNGSLKGSTNEEEGSLNVDYTFSNSNVSATVTVDGSAKAAFTDVIRIEVGKDFVAGQSTKGVAELSDEAIADVYAVLTGGTISSDEFKSMMTSAANTQTATLVAATTGKNSLPEAIESALAAEKAQLTNAKAAATKAEGAVDKNEDLMTANFEDLAKYDVIVKTANSSIADDKLGIFADGYDIDDVKKAFNELVNLYTENGTTTGTAGSGTASGTSTAIVEAENKLKAMFSTAATDTLSAAIQGEGTLYDFSTLETSTAVAGAGLANAQDTTNTSATTTTGSLATTAYNNLVLAAKQVAGTKVEAEKYAADVDKQQHLVDTLSNKELTEAIYNYKKEETTLATMNTANTNTPGTYTEGAIQEQTDKVAGLKTQLDKLNVSEGVLKVTDLFGNAESGENFSVGSNVDSKGNLTVTLKNKGDKDTVITIANADQLKAGDILTITTGAMTESKEAAAGESALRLQAGANAGQEISLGINSMKAADLHIAQTKEGVEGKALDVTKQASASLAVKAYDLAIQQVSTERAKMGAIQNRLEHTIANLDTSAENLQSAESRIRDVDMAEEMTVYSKNNILQQAAQSMLAQANQSTQGVLSLLQ